LGEKEGADLALAFEWGIDSEVTNRIEDLEQKVATGSQPTAVREGSK
jgi:hypothetical protein